MRLHRRSSSAGALGGVKADEGPHAWFLAELITTSRLSTIYFVWACVLVLSACTTAFVSEQFECFDLCGFQSRSCAEFEIDSSASCIDLMSRSWVGTGDVLPLTSVLRHHARIIVAQPWPLNATGENPLRVMLDYSSLREATAHAVLPNGSHADEWALDFAIAGDHARLKLPDGFRMDERASGFAIRLPRGAKFSNGTVSGQPLDVFSSGPARVHSGLNVIFMTLKPQWAITDVVVRYATLLLNLGVGVILARCYVEPTSAGGGIRRLSALLTALHDFALEFRVVIGYHALVCLFCDPLALATVLHPGNAGLRYWSDHFIYASFIGVTVTLITYFCLSLAFLSYLRHTAVQVAIIAVSVGFGLAYFTVDAVAASQGSSTSAAVSPTSEEEGESSARRALSIAGFVLVMFWCVSVAIVWFNHKDSLVYKRGRRLYFGRTRIRILALRVIASCVSLYGVYWLAVYLPIEQQLGGFVPANERTGMQDVVAASFISILNCALWTIWRYDPRSAPARAEQVHGTKGMFGTLAASSPSARESDASTTSPTFVVTAPLYPLWQVLRWTEASFQFFFKDAHSGYYFVTERQRMRFLHRHRLFRYQRSFFCFETANACLSLSNEVYYEAPAESCRASIAATQPAILGCLQGCCCCCAGSPPEDAEGGGTRVNRRSRRRREPGSDAKDASWGGEGSGEGDSAVTCGMRVFNNEPDEDMSDEDEPEGYCEARALDVEKHGYRLETSLEIEGVQVIMVSMCGEDAGPDVYAWGESTEAVLRSSVYEDLPAATSRVFELTTSSAFENHAARAGEAEAQPDAPRTGRMTHIGVSFRGTDNSNNVVADANIGRAVFQAMADRRANRARVHAGFEACWAALQTTVFDTLDDVRKQVASRLDTPSDRIPIVFTGHSLGGAVATLAAYAHARRRIPGPILVYTFAMPRLGNSVFVEEYNREVPESYRVVNENDKVACVRHCTRKHVGRTVIIDRDGNFSVEPNAIERLHNPLSGAGSSIRNHFLYRYGRALDKIFAAHGSPIKSFLISEPVEGETRVVDTTPAVASGPGSQRAGTPLPQIRRRTQHRRSVSFPSPATADRDAPSGVKSLGSSIVIHDNDDVDEHRSDDEDDTLRASEEPFSSRRRNTAPFE